MCHQGFTRACLESFGICSLEIPQEASIKLVGPSETAVTSYGQTHRRGTEHRLRGTGPENILGGGLLLSWDGKDEKDEKGKWRKKTIVILSEGQTKTPSNVMTFPQLPYNWSVLYSVNVVQARLSQKTKSLRSAENLKNTICHRSVSLLF